MKYGIDEKLEERADLLLRDSLEGVFAHHLKKDILTPWKQRDRWRHEVIGFKTGVPEKHERLGMVGRVRNIGRPDLVSRDGLAALTRHRVSRPAWDFAENKLPDGYNTITLECYKRMQDG